MGFRSQPRRYSVQASINWWRCIGRIRSTSAALRLWRATQSAPFQRDLSGQVDFRQALIGHVLLVRQSLKLRQHVRGHTDGDRFHRGLQVWEQTPPCGARVKVVQGGMRCPEFTLLVLILESRYPAANYSLHRTFSLSGSYPCLPGGALHTGAISLRALESRARASSMSAAPWEKFGYVTV